MSEEDGVPAGVSSPGGLIPPLPGRLPDYPSQRLVDRALDLLFPPICVGINCRKPGRWVCKACWTRLPWDLGWSCVRCERPMEPPSCPRCSEGKTPLNGVGAVVSFTDSAREAVHALKYHDRHAISSVLGHLMADLARPLDVDVVTHVPLHRSRRRERGYDQSWLLARHVARSTGRPVTKGLKRTRKTKQQALLTDRAARHANVAGAFEARHSFEGKTVLLVDDVTTTGATLTAAAEALQSAGAASVLGLVFARAR